MFGLRDAGDGRVERARLLDRAQKKYGGQTTTSKVIWVVKGLAQKYNVADLIDIEKSNSGTINITLKEPKFSSRLYGTNKADEFFGKLLDEISDCGYSFAVGDAFIQVHKV